MFIFLRSPQTHLRRVSRSMSVVETLLVPSSWSSTPARHLSSVSGRFRPDLASSPVSQSSHCWTNGLSLHTSTSYSTLANPEEWTVESRLASVKRKLKIRGIDAEDFSPGQYHGLMCPKCEGGDSREKSFGLFIDPEGFLAQWNCFRGKCGFKGVERPGNYKFASASASASASAVKIERKVTVESLQLEPLCDEVQHYFASISISKETLERNRVMQKSMGDEILIAFTYWEIDELVSCTYLNTTNDLAQEKDTRMILYGLNDIEEIESDIIIVQGEIDKLSMEEAGFLHCVSIPVFMDMDHQFLSNCNHYLKKASRIIIGTNGDVPGQALAEEVARRLGKHRCYRVKWPKKSTDEDYKDANEVLVHMGPESLEKAVNDAEPYPVLGLFRPSVGYDELKAYYHQTHGNEKGRLTGWKNVDNFYKVVPGELTIVTGVPNSGKSEWMDALLVNLNHSEGWKFALCSMENTIGNHGWKLMEKHVRKPFLDKDYGGTVQRKRMSPEEMEEAKMWVLENFWFIRSEMDSLPSVDWVLERAKFAVLRYGIKGLVIDPYNELDHQRSNQTETEYVSQLLTKIRRFAEHNYCHVWLVAHPKQLPDWDGSEPNLYDISGSAHFMNKCDNGIIIHRNRDEDAGPLDLVQVCVRKVRNKDAGRVGDAYLCYDRATGLYSESSVGLLKKKP